MTTERLGLTLIASLLACTSAKSPPERTPAASQSSHATPASASVSGAVVVPGPVEPAPPLSSPASASVMQDGPVTHWTPPPEPKKLKKTVECKKPKPGSGCGHCAPGELQTNGLCDCPSGFDCVGTPGCSKCERRY